MSDSRRYLHRYPRAAQEHDGAASLSLAVSILALAALGCAAPPASRTPPEPARRAGTPSVAVRLAPQRDSIPGTLVGFDMIGIPGGVVMVDSAGIAVERRIDPFYIGRTEVTWNEYDVFAFRLDMTREEAAGAADAESRPSRPYGAPDRGYGHDGFPALGMTYVAAAAYAEWLSKKTGLSYRVPSDAQWTLAAAGGGTDPAASLDSAAWHARNSGDAPHRVGSLRANRAGVHDMFGNVAEWVTGADGRPLVRGGSFIDEPASVGASARARQDSDWNATDPQFPKSRWWLSDAVFVGFRIVREE